MTAITHFFHFLWSLILASILALQPQYLSGQHSRNISYSSNNGKTTIEMTKNKDSFKIEMEGDISVSDDDRDITAISRGGYIEISKTAFGNQRKIEIESTGSGRLSRRYYVGSREQDYEPEGRRWLAEILPEVVRSTTIGAEDRVDRIYRRGGGSALMDEIRSLQGDHVKSTYSDLSLRKNMAATVKAQFLRVVGQEIHSDHHLAEILINNQQAFLGHPATVQAYMEVAGNINSDHHVAEVLIAAIENANISDRQVGELLDVTKGISSDHHIAEVLIRLMEGRPLTTSNIDKLIEVSHSINSDHHIAEVLSRLLKNDLDEDNLNRLLSVVDNNINSDHHKASVLSGAISDHPIRSSSFSLYLNALRSISSDHHLAEVIQGIPQKVQMTESQMVNLLAVTEELNSDHHLAETLIALAPQVNAFGGRAADAFDRAARNISSKHHLGSVMQSRQRTLREE